MQVPESLRILIRAKLADGRLPHDSLPGVWGGAGDGEICLACQNEITKSNFLMESIHDGQRTVQFHVQCFYVWDIERTAPGRPAPATGS